MKEFNTITEILDFAIGEEQAAVDFYLTLATQSKSIQSKNTFEGFAREEMQHKANLIRIKEEGIFLLPEQKVRDMKIAEYLIDVKPAPNLSYEDALILAMKKEKAAFRMYSKLAENATDPVVRDLFLNLAQEESKHKLRFEVEYDDYVLREN